MMLFTCYEKTTDHKCQLCGQKKDAVMKVRFQDDLKCRCCAACLWRHVDVMLAAEELKA
jgi:hypothetical protein